MVFFFLMIHVNALKMDIMLIFCTSFLVNINLFISPPLLIVTMACNNDNIVEINLQYSIRCQLLNSYLQVKYYLH